MNVFLKMLSPILIGMAQNLLKSLAQSVWDGVWDTLIEAIAAAETKFKSHEYAEAKKEFVITEVLQFVEKYRKLSGIQKTAVKLLLGRIIDKMIGDMNANHGRSWVEVTMDLKAYWAGRIPVIN